MTELVFLMMRQRLPTKVTRQGASFTLGVAAVAGLSMSPLMSGMSLGGAEAGRGLLSMLSGRSPGERPAGALLDTKLRKAAAAAPHQYALPRSRERRSSELPFMPTSPVFPAGATASPLSQLSSVPGPSFYGPGLPFASGPGLLPGPVIFDQPISSPGGPDGPVPPKTEGPGPNLTTAIPEPGVWLNMIFGFGAIATILRIRLRQQHVADASGVAG
jgi:hypothetical protein